MGVQAPALCSWLGEEWEAVRREGGERRLQTVGSDRAGNRGALTRVRGQGRCCREPRLVQDMGRVERLQSGGHGGSLIIATQEA